MYVVIIGCGRSGSRLASQLSKANYDVVIVDKDKEAFSSLAIEFSGFQVIGNALEYDILKKSRLDSADLLIAATSNDKINYMITQICQLKFPETNIIVRVIDPELIDLYDSNKVNVLSETDIFVNKVFTDIKDMQEEKQ